MNRRSILIPALALLLIPASLWSLKTGATAVSWEAYNRLLHGEEVAGLSTILWEFRLPRVLMSLLVGAGLSCSGASLQGLFRNPLVEPGLLGVSAGAALFAVLFFVFGTTAVWLPQWLPAIYLLPVWAFLGGLLVVSVIYRLAYRGRKTDITLLILAGIAINALAGAMIGLVLYFADDAALRNFTFWTFGNISGASWEKVTIAAPLILIPLLLLMRQYKLLNALAMGEKVAAHVGLRPEIAKKVLICLTALIVGTCVALTGMIGFVGMVVPHLVRMVTGPDNRYVLPGSALLGALLLLGADTAARTLVAPAELPIGILTALIGSPFFIWLLWKMKRTMSFS